MGPADWAAQQVRDMEQQDNPMKSIKLCDDFGYFGLNDHDTILFGANVFYFLLLCRFRGLGRGTRHIN